MAERSRKEAGREGKSGPSTAPNCLEDAKTFGEKALNETFGCAAVPAEYPTMPMVHESRRGVDSREDREDGMVDAVLYYDTMVSDDIRVTLGGWIDASSNVSNILSPPSYDWVAALRATLELGADAPKKLPTVLRGRALTRRDLREKRIITEQTGLTGDGLAAFMHNLIAVRYYFGWDGPAY